MKNNLKKFMTLAVGALVIAGFCSSSVLAIELMKMPDSKQALGDYFVEKYQIIKGTLILDKVEDKVDETLYVTLKGGASKIAQQEVDKFSVEEKKIFEKLIRGDEIEINFSALPYQEIKKLIKGSGEFRITIEITENPKASQEQQAMSNLPASPTIVRIEQKFLPINVSTGYRFTTKCFLACATLAALYYGGSWLFAKLR